MTRYDDEMRDALARYPAAPGDDALPADLKALIARNAKARGAQIAATARLMADWSPEDRAGMLGALAADLAEGGRISVFFSDDDSEVS